MLVMLKRWFDLMRLVSRLAQLGVADGRELFAKLRL